MTCPAPKANSVFIDFNSVGVMEIPSLDTGKEERPEGRKEGGRGGPEIHHQGPCAYLWLLNMKISWHALKTIFLLLPPPPALS